jgi:hypothetical protein
MLLTSAGPYPEVGGATAGGAAAARAARPAALAGTPARRASATERKLAMHANDPALAVAQARIGAGTAGPAAWAAPLDRAAPLTRTTVPNRVAVTGAAAARRRLVATFFAGGPAVGRVVRLHPGQRTIDVPIVVSGNRIDDEDRTRIFVGLEALHGVSVGDYLGGVTVLDDDPDPVMTITRLVTVTKGQTLRWHVSLSVPTNRPVFASGVPADPTTVPGGSPGGTVPELTTADVPADWLRGLGVEPPSPPRMLSAAGLFLGVDVPIGTTGADLEIPTLAGTAAGSRQVVWSLLAAENPLLAKDTAVAGVVTD